ncbi:MAG: DUF2933 domain-containing protein [Rhodospirillaceae bacterium]|nr:DUF2933 domain-containing protein [Rhodospirillaceae bacterium]
MNRSTGRTWWRHPTLLVAIVALGAAVLYASFVHIDHILVALPLLFILACPLMHLFMHRHGHGHAREHLDRNDAARSEDEKP